MTAPDQPALPLDAAAAVPDWVARYTADHPDLCVDTELAGRWGAASAVFSACRQWRYLLTRTWDPAAPPAVFVMLNPSTADAFTLDPTVHRCARFAQAWGAGGLVVANLFALRSTDPQALYPHPDPVGAHNDTALAALPRDTVATVVAWGVHGALRDRGQQVLGTLADRGPVCLGRTKAGHPRHPLYVAAATAPTPFA